MTDNGNDKTLHGAFGAKTADRVEQDYAADSELGRTLLRDLRQMLQPSAAARRLIEMGDQHGVAVRFLKGREEAVYVPENKWIFMSITTRTRPTARLALQYAGALREAEQNMMGFKRPDMDEPSDDEWLTQHVVKNVDIIKAMCQITQEISQQNQSDADFLDSLTALGHNEIYKAFVNQSSDDVLLRLYAKKEQLKIGEG